MARRKKDPELAKSKRFTMRITENDLNYLRSLSVAEKRPIAEIVLKAIKRYKTEA